MYSFTVVSTTLLRSNLQLALLLGICSGSILTEPVKARSTLAHSLPRGSFQQEDVWALIKTEDGVLFVWNLHELHFTLTVKGKEIKQVNVPDRIFLAVDGKTLQIQAAQISNFAPNARE